MPTKKYQHLVDITCTTFNKYTKKTLYKINYGYDISSRVHMIIEINANKNLQYLSGSKYNYPPVLGSLTSPHSQAETVPQIL